METSTNFKEWIEESRQDYKDMLDYLAGNNFEHVGQLTERNALLCMRRLEQPLQPLATWMVAAPQSYGLLSGEPCRRPCLLLTIWMQGRNVGRFVEERF